MANKSLDLRLTLSGTTGVCDWDSLFRLLRCSIGVGKGCFWNRAKERSNAVSTSLKVMEAELLTEQM
jgi:hypothetical protein